MSKELEDLLNESHFGQIRQREQQHLLGEVAWRTKVNGENINQYGYRVLTSHERDLFVGSGNDSIEPMFGAKAWSRKHFLLGDFAFIAKRRGTPTGYLSFSLLNNGDAIIVQVQGEKGRPFTEEKRDILVQGTLHFLKTIGTSRAFLVTGDILNAMRQTPEPRLDSVYTSIAQQNGFNRELYGLPYKDLSSK